MKFIYSAFIFFLITIYACNNAATPLNKVAGLSDSATRHSNENKNNEDSETTDSIKHAQLNHLKVVNEIDPVCGMSIFRGFDDTTIYKGGLIGFCSKECKDEFVKKPKAYKIKLK